MKVTTSISGTYKFKDTGAIDSYAFLYTNYSESLAACENLLIESDDLNHTAFQYEFQYRLQSNQTYILNSSTYSPLITGGLNIVTIGPDSIDSNRILSFSGPLCKLTKILSIFRYRVLSAFMYTNLTDGASWNLIHSGITGLSTILYRQTCGGIQYFCSTIQYASYQVIITAKCAATNAVQHSEVRLYGY
ncbi:unnamed protein product [Adineta ricciae]|uniref:Uncharacterized protein n=1 Tax=Adineta ricciae TaxID=249248 RepID=A0A815L7D7_ADIRI|nr:unnamed protein product [Adineta ricciae]